MGELIKAIRTWFTRVISYNPAEVIVELLLIGAVTWWIMRFLR